MKRLPAFLAFAFATVAAAQEYPNRPVRMVVGFPPGGGTDSIARMIARQIGRASCRERV